MVHAVIVCRFVHLSVTSRSTTKMAKSRVMQTMPYNTTKTLVYWCQRSWRNLMDHPRLGRQMEVGKVTINDFWSISCYISETVQD